MVRSRTGMKDELRQRAEVTVEAAKRASGPPRSPSGFAERAHLGYIEGRQIGRSGGAQSVRGIAIARPFSAGSHSARSSLVRTTSASGSGS